MKAVPTQKVLRHTGFGLCVAALLLMAGCSTQMLGALASAATMSSQSASAEERAEKHALASTEAVAEKNPELETEPAYLQMVVQMQRKQLWFASLAHLDVLESKWKVSDESRLLRADALRHVSMQTESSRLYAQLLAGPKAASAHHGLGLLAAQAEHYSEAVVQLEAARKSAPTDALLLNDLGYALLHTDQPMSARLPLMQAAQLAPQNSRIQANVALFLLLHGEGTQVTEWMNQHQMGESLRLQVFAQAQRMATPAVVAPVAAVVVPQVQTTSASIPHAPAALSAAPAPQMAPVATLVTQAPSMWMTERATQGVRP